MPFFPHTCRVAMIAACCLTFPAHAQPVPREQMQARAEQQAAMSTIYNMRSQCDNTAWVLWHSNDYKDWRKKRGMLSMNYSFSLPEKLPPAPATMAPDIKARYDATIGEAIAIITKAGTDFRDLATYINAKDYEDDGFKKGDEINARLLVAGETCHRLTKDIEILHADYALVLMDAAVAGDAAKATLSEQMKSDIAMVQALAAEMSKGVVADRASIEKMVADISARVEAWKALPEATGANARAVESFYRGEMEDNVAVEMRKMLRESKSSDKVWKEKLGDRPRSLMMQIRSAAYVQMPDDAVTALR